MTDNTTNLDGAAFWIRRPTLCREKGCNEPVVWAALYGPPGIQPRVEGTCSGHADTRWDSDGHTVIQDESLLVLAVEIGAPATCTLRPHGELCGNPEDHIAIYLVTGPEIVRLGPACSECLDAASGAIEQGYARVVQPGVAEPFDRLFGPPEPEPWWYRPVVNPELAQVLGTDYAEVVGDVVMSWYQLFTAFFRASAIALITVLAMAFVPRSGWWLLIGGLAPILALVIGLVTGSYRLGRRSFSDSESDMELVDGEVVLTNHDDDERSPLTFRIDAIAASLAFMVVYVSPGLIYSATLLMAGDWFGTSHGNTVATSGTWMVAAFVGAGSLLAGVVTFCVWLAWNYFIMVPSMLAAWFFRDK